MFIFNIYVCNPAKRFTLCLLFLFFSFCSTFSQVRLSPYFGAEHQLSKFVIGSNVKFCLSGIDKSQEVSNIKIDFGIPELNDSISIEKYNDSIIVISMNIPFKKDLTGKIEFKVFDTTTFKVIAESLFLNLYGNKPQINSFIENRTDDDVFNNTKKYSYTYSGSGIQSIVSIVPNSRLFIDFNFRLLSDTGICFDFYLQDTISSLEVWVKYLRPTDEKVFNSELVTDSVNLKLKVPLKKVKSYYYVNPPAVFWGDLINKYVELSFTHGEAVVDENEVIDSVFSEDIEIFHQYKKSKKKDTTYSIRFGKAKTNSGIIILNLKKGKESKDFAELKTIPEPVIKDIVGEKRGILKYSPISKKKQYIRVFGENLNDTSLGYRFSDAVLNKYVKLVKIGHQECMSQTLEIVIDTIIDANELISKQSSIQVTSSISNRTLSVSDKNIEFIEPREPIGIEDIVKFRLGDSVIDTTFELLDYKKDFKIEFSSDSIFEDYNSQHLYVSVSVYSDKGDLIRSIQYTNKEDRTNILKIYKGQHPIVWNVSEELKGFNGWEKIKIEILHIKDYYPYADSVQNFVPYSKTYNFDGDLFHFRPTFPPVLIAYNCRIKNIKPLTFNLGAGVSWDPRDSNGRLCWFSIGLYLMSLDLLSGENLIKNVDEQESIFKSGSPAIFGSAEIGIKEISKNVSFPIQIGFGYKMKDGNSPDYLFFVLGLGMKIDL